jgi:2-polyprenyl-6-methoxyphenol hydroxylase-like FAD-dependent oxidoreductase
VNVDESRNAVVLGAGIAGMLVATVLSAHFSRVTVLDRDTLGGTGPRRGVPQARHLHGLMERGRSILDELHPGLTADAVAKGAPTTEVLVGSRWYLGGLRAHPTATGLTTLLASRPLLEAVLRQRTAALPGVVIREGVAATGLAVEGGRVTGALVSGIGQTDSVAADLVVDATGRASRATEWLTAMGAQAPPEERVEVDLGYASRTYRHRPGILGDDLGVVVSTMPGSRGGGAILVEGDRWHVTLGGMLGDHPPTDHAGFTAWAATLPVPDVHEVVTTAEPLEDPVPHRFRGSVRRRYELLRAGPPGLLVVGDALCSFNPLYAQGMTVAAQQMLALRDCLREDDADLAGLPARFYARAARIVDVAWGMSTGADLNHPGVTGRRTARTRLLNAYVGRAHRAAHVDPAVSRAFLRVANLVDPPETLLRPAMAARILRRSAQVARPRHEIRG